jgi:hypothetical protein
MRAVVSSRHDMLGHSDSDAERSIVTAEKGGSPP